jgi:hypothetical protein
MDLGEFTFEYFKVLIFPTVDENKIVFKNKPENAKIIKKIV